MNIDVSIINKYMIQLDNVALIIVEGQIKEKGLEKAFNDTLHYLDCTRVNKDGSRPMQTIGYPYMREMSAAIYIADKFEQEVKEQCLLKLIERHLANIEYEKINPPIWYGGNKAKKSFEKKAKKLPRRGNDRKTTSAERKLKANALRLNLLKINIKSKQNDSR